MTEKLTEKSKKVIDNTLKMVYIIPCIAAVVRQPDAGKYARVAQWWSTSLPRRGSRVRSTRCREICASGSVVEHLLAKEGVAGSIPVSRSIEKIKPVLKLKSFGIGCCRCA